MDENKSQKEIEFVEELEYKVKKALNIRFQLAKDRISIMKNIEYSLNKGEIPSDESINKLRSCVKNEKNLIKIIIRGLEKSSEKLENINKWFKSNIKQKKLTKYFKKNIKIINLFKSKIEHIKKRIVLEETFLEKKDIKTYYKFSKKWDKELKLNKRFLKQTVDAGLTETQIKKLKLILKQAKSKESLEKALRGFGVGTVGSIFYVMSLVLYQQEWNYKLIISFLIGFTIAGYLKTFENLEREIERINMKEFENEIYELKNKF